MNYDKLIELLKIDKEKRSTYEKNLIKNILKKYDLIPIEYQNISEKSNYFYYKFIDTIKLRELNKSEKLFKLNDIADKMFIVLKGKLCLYIPVYDKFELNKKIENKNINDLLNINPNRIDNIIKTYKLDIKNNNKYNKILKYAYKNLNKIMDFCKIYLLLKNQVIEEEDVYFLLNENINKYVNNSGLKFFKKKYFKNGDIFGEMFLFSNKLKKRSGTIVSISKSIVGYISKLEYQNLFNNIKFIKIIDYFKSIFPKINEDIFIKIIYSFEKMKFYKNDFIFRENNKIENIFFILDGEVQIIKNKTYNLTMIKNKEFLGEDDILNNKNTHSYSTKIFSNISVVYKWDIKSFNILIKNFPIIYNYFYNISLLKRKLRKELYENLLNFNKIEKKDKKVLIKNIKNDTNNKTRSFNVISKIKKQCFRPKILKNTSESLNENNSYDLSKYLNFNKKKKRNLNLSNYYSTKKNIKLVQKKTLTNNNISLNNFNKYNSNELSFIIKNGAKYFNFNSIKKENNINHFKRNLIYKKQILLNKNKLSIN